MHGDAAARARDARMVNGVMALGGRNASAFEVDSALGLEPWRVQPCTLRRWLGAMVGRWVSRRGAQVSPSGAPAIRSVT